MLPAARTKKLRKLLVKKTASRTMRMVLSTSAAMLMRVGTRRKRTRGVMASSTTSMMKQAPIWVP